MKAEDLETGFAMPITITGRITKDCGNQYYTTKEGVLILVGNTNHKINSYLAVEVRELTVNYVSKKFFVFHDAF